MATSTGQAPASSTAIELVGPAPGHPLASQSDHHNASARPATTANIRPSVYSEPHPQNWYYCDPTRHWRSSSHFFTNPMPLSVPVPVPTPCIPPVQLDTAGKSTTDSMLEHVWASLKMLQSQFTAFQESLGTVNSDVKDALSQLRTLRIAQNKTEKSIADLEGIIGVTSRKGRTKGRGIRNKAVPDAGTVPENTLVQSVALIQSAIQVLLARENQASRSDLSADQPPSDFSGQRLSHIVDPHRQFSSLQSTQFILPTSQSGASSPLSQLSTPTPEVFHALPGKEYADASTQAFPLSPTSELSYSHKDTPILTPVDWSAVSVGLRHPVGTFAQQTAEQSRPLSSGTTTTTNGVTDSQMSQRDSDYPFHDSIIPDTQLHISAPFATHYSGTPQVLSTLPATLGSSVVPSASGSGFAAASSSRTSISTHSLSTHAFSLTTEAVGLSHEMAPSDASRMSSPLSSLTSAHNTLRAVSCDSTSEDQRHPDLLGVTQTVHSSANLTAGDVAIHASGPISVASGFRRHSTPIVADAGEEVPSGLPTPPSEASIDDHEPREGNRLTCEHASDPTSHSYTHIQSFPFIPVPPAPVANSSIRVNQSMSHNMRWQSVRQECFEAFSQSPSPLTPTPPSPYAGSGDSFPEKSVEDAGERSSARKVMEERIDCNTKGTAVSEDDGGEGASEDVTTLDSATNSGVPAISVTNEHPRSTSEFNDDSSPAPQAAGDGGLSLTPKSLARKPNLEPAEYHPDTGTTSVYSQMDGYDITFSSPWRHPPTSATPSRYTTPSDSRPSQEEDEVWNALVLGASGISTPMPDSPHLPLMFSHQTSRASSDHPHSPLQLAASTTTSAQESLAVDPSMLHDPPPSPRRSGLLNSPQEWNSSLSSLTSLVDMDDEAEQSRFKVSRSSFPLRAPTPPNTSTSRAVSEVMRDGQRAGMRSLGGPSASLDQLVLLARREPLKIHLKLPERMRGLKRKRDADGEGNKAGETSEAGGEHVRHGARGVVSKAKQEGQVKANSMRAGMSPCRTRLASSGTSRRTRPVPGSSTKDVGEGSDDALLTPGPRKRTKERDGRETQASIQHKGSKRASSTKQKSPSKYHVWNGQIVAVEMVSGSLPLVAAVPPQTPAISAPQPSVPVEEAGEELESLARLRHGQENQAMKAPLSSPAGRSSPRSLRATRSSPTKGGLWESLHQNSGTWPELPVAFSQWDVQFIQCDNCDIWYHYGCAGIQSKDPRLELGSLFICPTCHTQSARRRTLRYQDGKCARPDCPEPCITTDTETFYLEKLVGRKKMDGYLYMWLAKWEGYPMDQATWIPKENVFGDGTRMFNNFLEEALEEGADLSQDLILLREAVDAGWEER